MRKLSRWLALALCCALALSLFGCAGGEATGSVDGGSTTPASSDSDTGGDAPAPGGDGDYSEKMTISWASVQVKESTDYNADAFTQMWCEMFNVEWDMIPLTWDNWAEKLRIWINSGDMPDVVTWNYIHGEYATYVEQDLVYRLPDDWKSRWPNVATAYEATDVGPALDDLVGGTYGLPKPRFAMNKPSDVLPNHMGAFMRKDWMEAVGAEIKDAYTVDELLEIARLIKDQDPGNVGSRLAPIEVRTGNMHLMTLSASYPYTRETHDVFFKGEDGSYQWGPAQPEFLEALMLYQQAYQEGLLHPEFYTLKQDEDLEDFYTAGTAAITCEGGLAYYSNLYGKSMEQNLGLDPHEAMHFATILGNDGKYYSPEVINFWTFNLFDPDIDEAKFERIMDMFDYSCTQDGQYMLRMGIPGVDWELGSGGELINLMDEGETVDTKYDSIMPLYINMLILSDDFDMINPSYDEEYRERTKRQYALRTELSDETTLVPTDWNVFFHDSPSYRKVAFDYATEYAQLVVKDGSLEANWQAWVDEKMPLIQPVLDELDALS